MGVSRRWVGTILSSIDAVAILVEHNSSRPPTIDTQYQIPTLVKTQRMYNFRLYSLLLTPILCNYYLRSTNVKYTRPDILPAHPQHNLQVIAPTYPPTSYLFHPSPLSETIPYPIPSSTITPPAKPKPPKTPPHPALRPPQMPLHHRNARPRSYQPTRRWPISRFR